MMSRIVKGAVLFIALIALAILATTISVEESKLPVPNKLFSRKIAEGISVSRHGVYGIENIRCGSVRIQKKKIGFLTLGAFNELVLKDLAVVLPSEPVHGKRAVNSQSPGPKDMLDRMGVTDQLLGLGKAPLRFSDLCIHGLVLSRLDAMTNVVPILVARSAEARSNGLKLHDCGIIMSTTTNRVGEALLSADTSFHLSWSGGNMSF